MNHDAAHCLDYVKEKCPETCYRAQLTEELFRCNYSFPTSWSHLLGSADCKLKNEQRQYFFEEKVEKYEL